MIPSDLFRLTVGLGIPLTDEPAKFDDQNVGNPIRPASYDRGEKLRFGLLSVTEGEDNP